MESQEAQMKEVYFHWCTHGAGGPCQPGPEPGSFWQRGGAPAYPHRSPCPWVDVLQPKLACRIITTHTGLCGCAGYGVHLTTAQAESVEMPQALPSLPSSPLLSIGQQLASLDVYSFSPSSCQSFQEGVTEDLPVPDPCATTTGDTWPHSSDNQTLLQQQSSPRERLLQSLIFWESGSKHRVPSRISNTYNWYITHYFRWHPLPGWYKMF